MHSARVFSAVAMGALIGAVRGQDTDAAKTESDPDSCSGDFSLPREPELHIAAIFIQVAISLSGTLIPIILHRFNLAGRSSTFVFDSIRNFGTGIILSTGIIHLLLPAYDFLTNPCLPSLWTTEYVSFAGVFALAGMLLTQIVQTLALSFMQSIKSPNGLPPRSTDDTPALLLPDGDPNETKPASSLTATDEKTFGKGASTGTISSTSGETAAAVAEAAPGDHSNPYLCQDPHDHSYWHEAVSGEGSTLLKKQMSFYLLETGIASHSFFVGLLLGTARGTEFRALLVALAFHQFFEGMALSATLLDAKFKSKTPTIVMVLLYTVITPLGVAVGVAMSDLYNPNSITALLTQGIIDSLSSGILIYDSLVNLLHVNITTNPAFLAAPVWKKIAAYMFLFAGTAVMAFIGKYA
ncbi:Zinc/iron permease [Gonapodya prolifera JEL478]|uniref:Zinc/iron permease n=1 Tax=Gonapodya prolifera (strain JEL478) TaxID=1344416 RepID=A0A139AC58_GONPJ|nr:Zinc/iron permease [Gonapodya prolifera JEL478]|eukprot:KXS14386.1 Zinc/iron permease [Gonapodya prolifera JEL478]